MKSSLWDRDNPLFFYENEEKLNDLISRIYGEVVTGFQNSSKNGGKVSSNVNAKFGGFLSLFGIGLDAELGSELNNEEVRTRLSSITFDAKLAVLSRYLQKNERFPYIDILNGFRLERNNKKMVEEWRQLELSYIDKQDQMGQIIGLFILKRINPPHDNKANIVADLLKDKNNLWMFHSIADSKISAKIPFFIKNLRPNIQGAVITFMNHDVIKHYTNFKIEAMGLLIWNDGSLNCDPVAWRVFF